MAIPAALIVALLLLQGVAPSEDALRKAIADDPADVNAHFDLSVSLSTQHKDDEAMTELRRVLELKPGLYEADMNLALLLLRNGKASDAVPLLKQALETRPADQRTMQMYGQALLETGELAEAEKLFRASSFPNGLLSIAAAHEKAGRVSEAVAIYREFSDDPQVRARLAELTRTDHLALADSYRDAKQPLKVIGELQKAVQATPNDYELRMNLGRAHRDQRQLIPAAQQFLAATKLKPDSAEAWNELASALIIAEKYPEGLTALDRVRALGKEVPGDFYLRAITLDKLKMKPQAIAAYQQFLQADNGGHPDQDFLARQRIRIIESELKK